MPTPCSVPDCTGPAKVHGLCIKHYKRMYRRGSIEPRQKISPEVRQARADRLATLNTHRRKLGIPCKTISYYMGVGDACLGHVQDGTYRYGDTFLERYEAAIRLHCEKLRGLMTQWGY
jgi:hypothetical protein